MRGKQDCLSGEGFAGVYSCGKRNKLLRIAYLNTCAERSLVAEHTLTGEHRISAVCSRIIVDIILADRCGIFLTLHYSLAVCCGAADNGADSIAAVIVKAAVRTKAFGLKEVNIIKGYLRLAYAAEYRAGSRTELYLTCVISVCNGAVRAFAAQAYRADNTADAPACTAADRADIVAGVDIDMRAVIVPAVRTDLTDNTAADILCGDRAVI